MKREKERSLWVENFLFTEKRENRTPVRYKSSDNGVLAPDSSSFFTSFPLFSGLCVRKYVLFKLVSAVETTDNDERKISLVCSLSLALRELYYSPRRTFSSCDCIALTCQCVWPTSILYKKRAFSRDGSNVSNAVNRVRGPSIDRDRAEREIRFLSVEIYVRHGEI